VADVYTIIYHTFDHSVACSIIGADGPSKTLPSGEQDAPLCFVLSNVTMTTQLILMRMCPRVWNHVLLHGCASEDAVIDLCVDLESRQKRLNATVTEQDISNAPPAG
jgi:hypothetical protein